MCLGDIDYVTLIIFKKKTPEKLPIFPLTISKEFR